MKELQIITNKIQPAKVEFNYQDIDEKLDIVLKKYKGLVFTEDTVKDCKKTMAELRKGQKSLDEFRKKTKRILTESVTEFENDCKRLYKKFDDVIDPLKEQADFFEEQRREEKRQEVERLIEDVKEKFSLNEKYGSELTIDEKFLNASETISKVKEQLYVYANKLRSEQRQEEANISLIKSTVQSNNAINGINLLEDNYLRLLAYEESGTIIAKIYEDTNKLVKAKEEERLRAAEQEAERKTKEEEERLLQEQYEMAADMAVEEADKTVYVEMPEESELLEEAPLITKTFRVTGTPEQMKDLETFLNAIFEIYEEV
jgi:hypothetical protein